MSVSSAGPLQAHLEEDAATGEAYLTIYAEAEG
jgi:hypothetical protein